MTQMRISFDLDETLICTDEMVPREPWPAWYRRGFRRPEQMRLGTRALVNQLRDSGWGIWVYTTSFRSKFAIQRWMRSYGIALDGEINQSLHARKMSGRTGKVPSKNPAAFGIDLHVDDSEGVRMEGKQFGFAVVVVSPDDRDWVEVILRAAEGIASCRRP